jgi:hypothetical protein
MAPTARHTSSAALGETHLETPSDAGAVPAGSIGPLQQRVLKKPKMKKISGIWGSQLGLPQSLWGQVAFVATRALNARERAAR